TLACRTRCPVDILKRRQWLRRHSPTSARLSSSAVAELSLAASRPMGARVLHNKCSKRNCWVYRMELTLRRLVVVATTYLPLSRASPGGRPPAAIALRPSPSTTKRAEGSRSRDALALLYFVTRTSPRTRRSSGYITTQLRRSAIKGI